MTSETSRPSQQTGNYKKWYIAPHKNITVNGGKQLIYSKAVKIVKAASMTSDISTAVSENLVMEKKKLGTTEKLTEATNGKM